MILQLIVGIVGASIGATGVLGDVVTTQLALRKGNVESDPVLVKLHITTPVKLAAYGLGMAVLCTLMALYIPFIGAALATGVGVAGIVQTRKTIQIL